MKLYSKQGNYSSSLINGIGIQSSEAKIEHKQKQITNGSKRSRIEDKKDHVFNVATSFEKRNANKKARQSKYEFLRNRKKK
jgi:hypothetical protein